MITNLEIDNTTLDILTTKLKNTVSQLDILRWLTNFTKTEHRLALDVLQNLSVYTTDDIENILEDSFTDLIAKIPTSNQLIVVPMGKFGKSGSMISYFFQKTNISKNKRIHLKYNIKNLNDINYPYSLVIIDDFIGTGGSFITYFEVNILAHNDNFDKIYFIGIAGMELGINSIKQYAEVIIPKSNIFKKAFSSEASYFGYRKHFKHREFCYKYGSKLVSPKKTKAEKDNRLGYGNSQSLISFSYGTPNNTLPIIWSNKDNWIPLIPRFSRDRISKAKNIRKTISHELSILREFGGEQLKQTFFSFSITKGKRQFTTVNKVDFSIYTIIKLKRKKHSSVRICQILGILYKDYEEFIAECVAKNIMNTEEELTPYGINLYSDAKRCIESRKKYIETSSLENYKIKEINYLPKTFNGKS